MYYIDVNTMNLFVISTSKLPVPNSCIYVTVIRKLQHFFSRNGYWSSKCCSTSVEETNIVPPWS